MFIYLLLFNERSLFTYPERLRERPCEVLATSAGATVKGANSCSRKIGEKDKRHRLLHRLRQSFPV